LQSDNGDCYGNAGPGARRLPGSELWNPAKSVRLANLKNCEVG
jgi:hypothetical protein